MHFTLADIIFSVIVLILAVMACAKGFIKELFGKLAVIAGLAVSIIFSGKLSPYLEKFINSQVVCIVLSFILLFVTTFLLVKIIQSIFSGIFGGEILQSLDRILGFVLGVIEGLAVVSAVIIILKAQPWWTDASSAVDATFYWNFLGRFLDKPITALKGIFV